MPLVSERLFRVRHYECDAYGHLNHTQYLRYMQEAAIDASAAAGYDLTRYEALGCYWLVRDTDIEYLRPLRYGDTVRVQTWVVDFGRVRSRRAYEFHLHLSIPPSPHPGESLLVARAQTDWAFLEQASGRPAVIPPELKAAFFPEGTPEPVPGRDRFPAQPPQPAGVVKVRRRVEWRDIDPAQHVNNATYMAYMEDAGVQAALSFGWPVARMVTDGFAIVAHRYRIEYRQPAVLDDELEVATWVSDVRRATAMRHYVITRPADGQLLARASAHWVWVDLQTGQPIRIPAHFKADFRPNISE